MTKIIPIKELKDTAKISNTVRESEGPVHITKNGYGDMVIMSTEEYDRLMYEMDIMEKLLEGEQDIREGRVVDAFESVERIMKRYGL